MMLATASMGACASGASAPEGESADAEGPRTKKVCYREPATGSRTKGARICKEVLVD